MINIDGTFYYEELLKGYRVYMEKRQWLDKPYNNLNYDLRKKFDSKVMKLSVDGGFSCPNRDGKVGTGGCIFCSEKGSGEFAGTRGQSIREQIQEQIELLKNKWPEGKYIVYFQNFSNTYGSLAYMEKQFREAMTVPGVVGLAIATRVDCVDASVLTLLSALRKEIYLWVELGLQSILEEHHEFLNTGYMPWQFQETVKDLANHDIDVVGHIILGLPNSEDNQLDKTITFLNELPIKGLKIHMLNILKRTKLGRYYMEKPFSLMSMETYLDQLIYIIERLRQDIVIHRVTGDGAKELLIEPNWILNKRKVLNELQKLFRIKETYQGKYYT